MKLIVDGCGSMGSHHISRFQKMGADIAAIVHSDENRAITLCERYDIEKWYPTLEDALASVDDADAVTCAKCDAMHYHDALLALDHGLDLFMEKPMCRTSDECRDVCRRAEEKGCRITVNFSKKNNGSYKAVRENIDMVGRIEKINLKYLQSWMNTLDWGDWRENNRLHWRLDAGLSTFGCLGDLGIHLLELMCDLGFRIDRCAKTSTTVLRQTDFEDIPDDLLVELDSNPVYVDYNADLILTTGIPARFETSFIRDGFDNSCTVEIIGEKGRLSCDFEQDRHKAFFTDNEGNSTELTSDSKLSTYELFMNRDLKSDADCSGERALDVQLMMEAMK